jgi:hypothetical protein
MILCKAYIETTCAGNIAESTNLLAWGRRGRTQMTKHSYPTRSKCVALFAPPEMIEQINKIARSRQMSFSEWTRQAMAAALKRESARRKAQRAAA